MNTEQLKALHDEIHKAVMVDGWARSWTSTVRKCDGRVVHVSVDVMDVYRGCKDAIVEILLKYGLHSAPWCDDIYSAWSCNEDAETMIEGDQDAEKFEGGDVTIEGSLGMDGFEVNAVGRGNG